nr:hypothetical protein CFP56_50345 [Quercus suber]
MPWMAGRAWSDCSSTVISPTTWNNDRIHALLIRRHGAWTWNPIAVCTTRRIQQESGRFESGAEVERVDAAGRRDQSRLLPDAKGTHVIHPAAFPDRASSAGPSGATSVTWDHEDHHPTSARPGHGQ